MPTNLIHGLRMDLSSLTVLKQRPNIAISMVPTYCEGTRIKIVLSTIFHRECLNLDEMVHFAQQVFADYVTSYLLSQSNKMEDVKAFIAKLRNNVKKKAKKARCIESDLTAR